MKHKFSFTCNTYVRNIDVINPYSTILCIFQIFFFYINNHAHAYYNMYTMDNYRRINYLLLTVEAKNVRSRRGAGKHYVSQHVHDRKPYNRPKNPRKTILWVEFGKYRVKLALCTVLIFSQIRVGCNRSNQWHKIRQEHETVKYYRWLISIKLQYGRQIQHQHRWKYVFVTVTYYSVITVVEQHKVKCWLSQKVLNFSKFAFWKI